MHEHDESDLIDDMDIRKYLEQHAKFHHEQEEGLLKPYVLIAAKVFKAFARYELGADNVLDRPTGRSLKYYLIILI